MPTAYIGIGSNLGNRLENCLKALDLLERRGIRVTALSSPYETKPWGMDRPEIEHPDMVAGQPDFINMAARIETDLGKSPLALLETLQEVEREMGRVRREKWGPRIIDLDILLYGDEVVDIPDGTEGRLKVPHPLMHLREFVLKPLAEIAPQAIHPVLKKTISQLLAEKLPEGS